MTDSHLIAYFSEILPQGQILTAAADLEFYGKDVCKQFSAHPSLVLTPSTPQQVADILKICSLHKIAVVPSGGRTGYSAGATATQGEVILSLTKMTRVLEVNAIDQTITVEAGVTTETVRQKAAEHGLYYGVDFTSKGSSHIGGNIATNAGGIRVIRYGNTRDWVLGLVVALPNGELLRCNGKLFKNQTGYDFKSLFIGSEGTLGVIVEATLKLCRPPRESRLCLCGAKDPSVALEVLTSLRKQFTVNVFEYFERSGLELVTAHSSLVDPFKEAHPCYLLIEIEAPHAEERQRFEELLSSFLETGVISDAVLSESSKHSQDLMSLRELIGEMANKHHVPHKNDISVPVPEIPAFLHDLRELFTKKYPQYPSIIFGHVGDGNLHVNVLKPESMEAGAFFKQCETIDQDLFTIVAAAQGSISAEHGVGLLKKPLLHLSRTPEEIDLMRAVKQVFDPAGILNPGKIF